MSIPRHRINKFSIPGLSDIWNAQIQCSTTQRVSKDYIKKKEIYKAYDHDIFIPLRIKSRKKPEPTKKKKEIGFSYQETRDKGFGTYRYLDKQLKNSSRKNLERLKVRDRSSFLQSYRPSSRTSRNASASRIQQIRQKDIYRKLVNRSHLQDRARASKLNNNNQNSELCKAKELYNQGNLIEAQIIFTQLLEQQESYLESQYFLAIISMRRREFYQAIDRFNTILKSKQNYKKTVYLFLCMAYKNVSKHEQSLQIANRGLCISPMYIDLLMYRGKLFMNLKNYIQADKDYNTVINIKDNYTEAYFKRVQCLIHLNQLKKAGSILTALLLIDEENKPKILQQRARLFYTLNQIQDCKKDIQKLLQMKIQNSELYELKGSIEVTNGKVTQGLLSFEQSVKLNTSKQAVQASLIWISKCKINDLDYYSAYHQISRAHFLGIKTKNTEIFRLFTEGVVFLMKRKTQQGIKNLNTLLSEIVTVENKSKVQDKFDKFQDNYNYIIKRFYVYRAYGYFVLGQHQLSLKDYYESQKHTTVERHTRYNSTLAEGIIETKNKSFQKAYLTFQKAKLIYQNKLQPLLYRAVTLVQKSYSQEQDEIIKIQLIISALKQLDTAYDINPNQSNLLFLRALLFFYLRKINQGLQSISKAMAKSEENVPKYFYYRGLGNGSLKNFKQCQNDFTIVINLDRQYADAYLQRAKTFFILQNIERGIQDLDQYQKLRPLVDRNYLQGNLYFSHQDFQIALSRYEKAKQSQQTIYMKTKSYICLGQLKLALAQLESLNKEEYTTDICVLKYLINSTANSYQTIKQYNEALRRNINRQFKIFNKLQIHHYIGSTYFQLGDFTEAIQQFKKAFKERQFLNVENSISQGDCSDDQMIEQAQIQINQINYNIFLCYVMLGELKHAHELFLKQILPAKDLIPQGEILEELCLLIFQSIKGVNTKNQMANEIDVNLFCNPLSDITPNLSIKLKGGKLRTKLCHLLPSIVVREMKPQIKQQQILHKIQVGEVQNKPQPPWVRRNDQSTLIFTGHIQDMGIQFQTEQNQQTSQYQQQHKSDGEYESSLQQSSMVKQGYNIKNEIERLKNQFKLEESVERKLNSLINNNK